MSMRVELKTGTARRDTSIRLSIGGLYRCWRRHDVIDSAIDCSRARRVMMPMPIFLRSGCRAAARLSMPRAFVERSAAAPIYLPSPYRRRICWVYMTLATMMAPLHARRHAKLDEPRPCRRRPYFG